MIHVRALATALLLSVTVAACGGESETSNEPVSSESNVDATVQRHVEVVRQRIAACNAKDWNTWESLHTANAVRTSPDLPQPLVGAKAMRAGIEELVKTFPDYHLELVDAIGSGDRLVARIHTRGTMTGSITLGDTTVPATGKSFEQDWVAILRFEDGRIASIDEFYDNYGTLVQLGLSGE